MGREKGAAVISTYWCTFHRFLLLLHRHLCSDSTRDLSRLSLSQLGFELRAYAVFYVGTEVFAKHSLKAGMNPNRKELRAVVDCAKDPRYGSKSQQPSDMRTEREMEMCIYCSY